MKHKYTILISLTLVVGAWFRFWDIFTFPPGLFPDVAANGLDAQDILKGNILPFFWRNGGREGLFYFIATPIIFLSHNSRWALYLTSAIIGFLTLPLMYWFVKEYFSRRIAFFSTFFLSISFYHVLFSHLGYRVILLPPLLLLSLITLLYAKRSNNTKQSLIAGIVFGLGMYTYIAFRIYPLVLEGMLWYIKKYYPKIAQHITKAKINAFLKGALFTTAPFLLYTLVFPWNIFSRVVDSSARSDGNLIITLAEQVLKTIMMFHFTADSIPQYNVVSTPLLLFGEGIVFIIGIGLFLSKIKHPKYLLLTMVFLSQVLPIALSSDVPHVLRGVGMLSILPIFLSLGLDFLWNPLRKRSTPIALIALFFFLGLDGYYNYHKFFVDYKNQPEIEDEFSVDLVAMSQYVLNHEIKGNIYFVLPSIKYSPNEFIDSKDCESLSESTSDIPTLSFLLFDPRLETGIDLNNTFFWEGYVVKYFLRNKIDYHVRSKTNICSNEPGTYLYGSRNHSDFRKYIENAFDSIESVYKDENFEVITALPSM